ncbi:putative impact protein [Gregarina niphandrodes]|uniref:Impact protein n=1 Tax=Gregarina niphandrodes TaxID=110365 RepID=A0A023B3R8_GRENI|nr:putative impact protein [Gregarina niphandrodes]EZG55909.1 putative impact protein [Gregarina niphandrodes]|eukprot:XP_011131416.1 putative impact protein [Gregarina niphandrodes]
MLSEMLAEELELLQVLYEGSFQSFVENNKLVVRVGGLECEEWIAFIAGKELLAEVSPEITVCVIMTNQEEAEKEKSETMDQRKGKGGKNPGKGKGGKNPGKNPGKKTLDEQRPESWPEWLVDVQIDAPWLAPDLLNLLSVKCGQAAIEGMEGLTPVTSVIDCVVQECSAQALIEYYKQKKSLRRDEPQQPKAPDLSPMDDDVVGTEMRLVRIEPGTSSRSFRKQIPIHHGHELIDRKSIFMAHLAPVRDKNDINDVLNTLSSNNKYARATHNMVSYRLVNSESKICVQDHDSDGEANAGSNMQWLMNVLKVENVVVIVSRWYGGIHLGPDRFKHIYALTRAILDEHGYINSGH